MSPIIKHRSEAAKQQFLRTMKTPPKNDITNNQPEGSIMESSMKTTTTQPEEVQKAEDEKVIYTKDCPFCMEEINSQATICHYCHSYIGKGMTLYEHNHFDYAISNLVKGNIDFAINALLEGSKKYPNSKRMIQGLSLFYLINGELMKAATTYLKLTDME